jgi:16S rRNA (guanine(966)-N(2))-methyltransferase RsmD
MAGLRVIGGEARGRKLRMVPGEGTRPISDRVKESLFNILGGEVEQANVLDLFAGTGSVGIEALSRGAAWATFIENDPKACQVIRENLLHTRLEARGDILRGDVFRLLTRPPQRAYDLVHIAPPQYRDLWDRTLLLLDEHIEWLRPDATVVVQVHPVEVHPVSLSRLQEFDRRKYGSTLLVFYEWPST